MRGHICSFLQVREVTWLHTSRVWLDWIDHWSFIPDYRLVHTWSTHRIHKSIVQWMLILFVWSYVFKCDMYTLLLVDQTQKYFWVIYMFLKLFLCFYVLSFFFILLISCFLTKNSFRCIFVRSFVSKLFPWKWGWQKFKTQDFK